jgi:pimeloyl-ACP methyl ester carboxylesterase
MVKFLFGVLAALYFLAQPNVFFGQTPQTNTSPSSWEKVDCPFDTKKALLPVTCGRLKVPENYDDPKSRLIEVAFMIISPEKKIDPDSAVIFLSGGPGSPALVHVETLVTTPAIREVVVDRDWVFFDQRGGGRSVPAFRCGEEEDWFQRVKNCRDQFVKQGVDLSQYNSARIARDMEELRKVLGVKQWNVWGASYGARLAFTFTRYYPTSTRTLLVDGPYMPEEQEVVSDLQGAEVVLNKIFWKCSTDKTCSSKFPQLRSRFLGALPKLRKQPIEVEKEKFDDWRVTSFLQNTMYGGAVPTFERRVQYFLEYADAAARGDGKLMLQIEQQLKSETPKLPNLPDQGKWSTGQNLSIDCHEEKPFESVEEYAQAAAKSDIVRALFGSGDLGENFKTCALWGAGRAEPIENTRVYYDGPILAFTGELDPTLSGIAGYKVEMIYANARHVVFKNSGHAQFYIRTYNYSAEEYPYRKCALELGRQFLSDPQRKLDTSCAETRQLRLVK